MSLSMVISGSIHGATSPSILTLGYLLLQGTPECQISILLIREPESRNQIVKGTYLLLILSIKKILPLLNLIWGLPRAQKQPTFPYEKNQTKP